MFMFWHITVIQLQLFASQPRPHSQNPFVFCMWSVARQKLQFVLVNGRCGEVGPSVYVVAMRHCYHALETVIGPHEKLHGFGTTY